MRRLSGVLLAAAILVLPALSQDVFAQDAPQKQTFTGDVVIAAYIINPGKEADYERVIATLKDSLMKSERPEAKQQLMGWQVIKNSQPQPDGGVLYVHIIKPVPGADYSITNLVYEAVTDPQARTDFYNLYRGALMMPLFVIQGPMVNDLGKM
jgi:hypothetical protein